MGRFGTCQPSVFDTLRAVKAAGLAAREQIALSHPDPDFAFRYLTECIHYDLGTKEKSGIRRFESLSRRHGLLPDAKPANLDFR